MNARSLFSAAETIAGGLIASLIHEYNVSVAYVVTTLGQAGWHTSYNVTRDYVGEVRRQEQLNAAAVMGVQEVFFLDQQDGFLEGVDPVQLKVNLSRVIRIWQPDVVGYEASPTFMRAAARCDMSIPTPQLRPSPTPSSPPALLLFFVPLRCSSSPSTRTPTTASSSSATSTATT